MLLRPTRAFLDALRAAGGHFFLLEQPGAADMTYALKCGSGSDGQQLEMRQVPVLPSAAVSGGSFSGSAATTLYMPAGWFHYVVGLTEWHVVFGGSFYPEAQEPKAIGRVIPVATKNTST